jgi:hypothetical protein
VADGDLAARHVRRIGDRHERPHPPRTVDEQARVVGGQLGHPRDAGRDDRTDPLRVDRVGQRQPCGRAGLAAPPRQQPRLFQGFLSGDQRIAAEGVRLADESARQQRQLVEAGYLAADAGRVGGAVEAGHQRGRRAGGQQSGEEGGHAHPIGRDSPHASDHDPSFTMIGP